MALNKQKRFWIVDADISGCFDPIGHHYLIETLKYFPAKELIKKWLKAGILQDSIVLESTRTPQASIVRFSTPL